MFQNPVYAAEPHRAYRSSGRRVLRADEAPACREFVSRCSWSRPRRSTSRSLVPRIAQSRESADAEREQESNMPRGLQLATRPRDGVRLPASPRAAVRVRLQHQPLHRLPDAARWPASPPGRSRKGQEHMWWNNVETKPYGGYPQSWDVKILDLLEQANPGGQRWTGSLEGRCKAPYGKFNGKTIFEAAEDRSARTARSGARLPADRRGVVRRRTSTRTTRSARRAAGR